MNNYKTLSILQEVYILNKKLEYKRDEHNFYSLEPAVVPANQQSVITIKPKIIDLSFNDNSKYQIIYKAKFNTTENNKGVSFRKFTVTPQKGALKIKHYFAGEQEHVFEIKEKTGSGYHKRGDFYVYSLKDDLLKKIPVKGDLHLHSFRSDGKGSPAYITALGRKAGFDFMALTDHGKYQPSLEAKKSYQELPLEFQIIPGEEIHPPDTENHIVNFGGHFSVTELFEHNREKYYKDVNKILQSELYIPDGVDEFEYASFIWTCKKIKEGKGLSLFCHPYWVSENQHYISNKLTSFLLKKQPFDALEIINGSISVESNNLQVIKYYNHLTNKEDKKEIPLVGVSDAHNCDLGSGYTVVFVDNLPSPTENITGNIIENIKEGNCVAVEDISSGQCRAYGPTRLVRFAHFLLREIFPGHDKICKLEGEYMQNSVYQKSTEIEETSVKQYYCSLFSCYKNQ